MNFLQPQFLYGLFALAIPIIVHLSNFRKTKKVYFTHTTFLQYVQQTSKVKRKLKHYLVLLSRLLALFFIVMAFAQPFLPSSEQGLQNKHVIIYLDNSQSMSNLTSEEIFALGEGITYVNQLIKLYPKETLFLLVTNDFDPFSNTFKNGYQIIDRMTELSLSNATRSFREINNRITSTTLANNVHNCDVYWISDFQKSTLGKLESNTIGTTTSHYLLPIALMSVANLYVDSVYLDNPFNIEVNKSTVNTVVKNSGEQPISEAILRLYVNGQQISSKAIDLEGKSKSTVSFDVVYKFEEHNRARFSVEDYPIVFDNDFYFNLNAQQRLKVVEIRGDTEVLAVEKVYGNTTLFDFQQMPEGNIDYDQFHDADLIILHELTHLTTSLANKLFEYKHSGGKLAIIPSASFHSEEYILLTSTTVEVLDLKENEPLLSLQKLDFDHPFYADIFEKTTDAFTMPKAKSMISWKRLNPLLKLNSGQPFLSYHEEQAITYIFSCSLSPTYTNFAQQAVFVPIMYKLASYKSNNSQTLYQSLNQLNISVKMDSIRSNSIYKLKQGEKEFIPDQLTSGNELLINLPKNKINAGFAELILNKQLQQVMAFNHPRQESNPQQWSREDLQSIANNNAQLVLLNTTEADHFAVEMKNRYEGIHLWKYAIVFALLFLLIEMLVVRFYKSTEK